MKSRPASANSTWRSTQIISTSPGRSAPAWWMARSCASGSTRPSCGTGGRKCDSTSMSGMRKNILLALYHITPTSCFPEGIVPWLLSCRATFWKGTCSLFSKITLYPICSPENIHNIQTDRYVFLCLCVETYPLLAACSPMRFIHKLFENRIASLIKLVLVFAVTHFEVGLDLTCAFLGWCSSLPALDQDKSHHWQLSPDSTT